MWTSWSLVGSFASGLTCGPATISALTSPKSSGWLAVGPLLPTGCLTPARMMSSWTRHLEWSVWQMLECVHGLQPTFFSCCLCIPHSSGQGALQLLVASGTLPVMSLKKTFRVQSSTSCRWNSSCMAHVPCIFHASTLCWDLCLPSPHAHVHACTRTQHNTTQHIWGQVLISRDIMACPKECSCTYLKRCQRSYPK